MEPLPSSPIDPGWTTAVDPSLQRTVAVAPMRTMIMTTAGLARKTADWSSDSVAASDTGGTVAARTQARTAMTWARFFDAYEPVHALVAEGGGELLGLTHYLFHRSTTMIEPNCYLQDLFTSAAMRVKGVGRALINGVYEQAKLAGSSRVYWQTHETNHTAMQLYDKVAERSGFVVYRKLL